MAGSGTFKPHLFRSSEQKHSAAMALSPIRFTIAALTFPSGKRTKARCAPVRPLPTGVSVPEINSTTGSSNDFSPCRAVSPPRLGSVSLSHQETPHSVYKLTHSAIRESITAVRAGLSA